MATTVAVVNGHSGHGEKLKSDISDVRLFSGYLAGSSEFKRVGFNIRTGKYRWEKKWSKQTDESLRQVPSSIATRFHCIAPPATFSVVIFKWLGVIVARRARGRSYDAREPTRMEAKELKFEVIQIEVWLTTFLISRQPYDKLSASSQEYQPVQYDLSDDNDGMDGAGATGAIIPSPLALGAKFNIMSTMIQLLNLKRAINSVTKTIVDNAASGSFVDHTFPEASEILEKMTKQSQAWNTRDSVVASPTVSGGITAEQCRRDEERDQDITHLKMHMDLLTKHLISVDEVVDDEPEEGGPVESEKLDNSDDALKKEKEKKKELVLKTIPRPPPLFPQQLKKKTDDTKFSEFMAMLNQLTINVPLVEALEKMPGYMKFMKDLFTKK
ncbi:hypothetical protein FXO38_26157 [Capsicum annuum]|nr:hypothetical protein FXO38_26157 [Capsicum annuum]